MQVPRLAFTISPLKPSAWNCANSEPEDAPECMVTVLVRADLGGALGWGSYMRPLLAPLGLVWLASLIRSLVQVRLCVHIL